MIVLHKIFNKLAAVVIALVLILPIIFAPALASPSEPFVLKDSSGTQTPYSKLQDVVLYINAHPGTYTLYLTKDYDMSQDGATEVLNGNIDLTVCSLNGRHTLTNANDSHFKLLENVKLSFKNIVLDGGDKKGGIYVDNDDNPDINSKSHIILDDGFVLQNCDSLAIYLNSADLTINKGSNIIANKYCAIHSIEHSIVTINGGTFKDNGQALYFAGETLDINGGTFENNFSSSSVPTIWLYTDYPGTSFKQNISIKNAAFIGNKSSVGGAITFTLKNIENNKVDIINCTFKNNRADIGGAFYLEIPLDPDILFNIENCRFIDNFSEIGGGAIYNTKFTDPDYKYNYSDNPKLSAYDNLIIDASTVFSGNKSGKPYSLPPTNYKDFTNLKFKSNSFTGKGYPSKMHVADSLLNNYDINYEFSKFAYGFNANGGRFNDGTGERVTDYLSPGEVYTIFSDVPQKGSAEFLGWEDENGKLHKAGEKLPEAKGNRLFIAKWKEIINAPQTGDTFNIALYVVLATMAMIVFGFIVNKKKLNK